MRPELVIFDCDGVLVDSEPAANRLLAQCFQEADFQISYEDCMRDFVGLRLETCAEQAERSHGRSLPEGFVADVRARTLAVLGQGIEAVPGARGAVAALAAAGLSLCVASSGEHSKMEVTLGATGLWSAFHPHIFSASQVARGKPHPDLFLFAAQCMNVEPENCAVIEDSPYGIQAARAAGMRALGYVGGGLAKDLAAHGAETFTDMSELPARFAIGTITVNSSRIE